MRGTNYKLGNILSLTICVPQHKTKEVVSKLHMLMNFISSCVTREIDFDDVLELLPVKRVMLR